MASNLKNNSKMLQFCIEDIANAYEYAGKFIDSEFDTDEWDKWEFWDNRYQIRIQNYAEMLNVSTNWLEDAVTDYRLFGSHDIG